MKVISRTESMRIAKFAFDYAVQKGRHKVTAIHKANIMFVLWMIWLSFILCTLP